MVTGVVGVLNMYCCVAYVKLVFIQRRLAPAAALGGCRRLFPEPGRRYHVHPPSGL